jgi:CRISPR system Cascade subunit CasB
MRNTMSDQSDQAVPGLEKRTYYWARFVRPDGGWRIDERTRTTMRPPGEDLAKLRSGLGPESRRTVEIWRFCATPVVDHLARRGEISAAQRAELAALALFGLHQQSQSEPMHRPGVTAGQALRGLRGSGKFSEQALDARVNAAATANNPRTLLAHLHGLVKQLRTVGQPLDYDLLLTDLRDFHTPTGRARVRERWGLAYYGWKPAAENHTDGKPVPAA